MAEYVEVMNQKRRMCNSYALCNMGCPLYDTDFCGKNSGEKIGADFSEVERRTMAWAAEHPEPVYPTWEEWLQSVGVMESSKGLLSRLQGQLFIDGIPAHAVPTSKVLQPMDADIAQKLGIEPKEG